VLGKAPCRLLWRQASALGVPGFRGGSRFAEVSAAEFSGAMAYRYMARRDATTIRWRRPVSDTLATGTIRRTWQAIEGGYRVEEHKHRGLRTVYLAIDALCLFITQHRKRREAIARCELSKKRRWRVT
jgi:hypothetical protein